MPPFRLEPRDRLPTHRRTNQIIYTKNVYSEGVKVQDWEKRLESKPIEVDPYCPGALNYFASHYKRLGNSPELNYLTTTGEALKQGGRVKREFQSGKLMENYYTYNDNAECATVWRDGDCPKVCADEFLTTMQGSYGLPKPCPMPRLAFPVTPFMQNRRYKNEDPYRSCCKFFDDRFHYGSAELQKYRGFRYVSFNPMTGAYTDEKI